MYRLRYGKIQRNCRRGELHNLLRRPLHKSLGRCGRVVRREPGPDVHIRLRRGWRLVLSFELARGDIIDQVSNRSGVRCECRGRQLQQLFQRELELLPNDLQRLLLLLPLQRQRVVQQLPRLFEPAAMLVQRLRNCDRGSCYRRRCLHYMSHRHLQP